jgi:hypothetical protein
MSITYGADWVFSPPGVIDCKPSSVSVHVIRAYSRQGFKYGVSGVMILPNRFLEFLNHICVCVFTYICKSGNWPPLTPPAKCRLCHGAFGGWFKLQSDPSALGSGPVLESLSLDGQAKAFLL